MNELNEQYYVIGVTTSFEVTFKSEFTSSDNRVDCRKMISNNPSQVAYRPTLELSWGTTGDVHVFDSEHATLTTDLNNPVQDQHKFIVNLQYQTSLPV